MDTIVESLVEEYERGRISRRDLVKKLAGVAAAGAAPFWGWIGEVS